jgi:signal transduction histidine kinase
VVVGGAVFLAGRAAIFGQVDDDLESRVQPIARDFARRVINGEPPRNALIPPGLTPGGYFFALMSRDGEVIQSSIATEDLVVATQEQLDDSVSDGPSYFDSQTAGGEDVRLYVVPVAPNLERGPVMVIGRSIEPEQQAVRRLGFILIGGAFAGVLLAVGGGYVLSGLALRPIKQAMDQQQAFVADASHELRTPLALIRLNAEVLKREADKPVRANSESVDDIIDETDRLTGLVKQMLTLARSDAEAASIERSPVDLAALVEDSVREMRRLGNERGVPLATCVNGSVTVEGDPLRLRELVTILVDNAIKYSQAGEPVAVSVERAGAKLLLRVEDRGRGIAQSDLPHIFDRFYRAEKARSREAGGSGLGLAIAKWIVNAHGGEIAIRSEVGRGTTVTVELPAAG